jgi:hypothetical protein
MPDGRRSLAEASFSLNAVRSPRLLPCIAELDRALLPQCGYDTPSDYCVRPSQRV